ncbi:MAG: zinc ribbon domain-containing protein [Promethearchaeota archaeon]
MSSQEKMTAIERWRTFSGQRTFYKACSTVNLLVILSGLIYLLVTGSLIIYNLKGNILLYFMPVFIALLFPPIISLVCVIISYKRPIGGNLGNINMMRFIHMAIIMISLSSLIYVYSYFTAFSRALPLEENSGQHAMMIVFLLSTFILSFINLALTASLSRGQLAKKVKSIRGYKKLNFKKIFPGIFKQGLKNYWQIFVMFVIFQFAMKALYLLLIGPINARVVMNEAIFLKYLQDINYYQGMDVPSFLINDAKNLYNLQLLGMILGNVLQDSFYFFSVGACVPLVVNSLRGRDMNLKNAIRAIKQHWKHLVPASILFALFYDMGLFLLVFPGLLVYVYMIMIFPNITVVGKYKFFQNFGKSKDLIKKNFTRTLFYVLFIFLINYIIQFSMNILYSGIKSGIGGDITLQSWIEDPYGHFGELYVVELIKGVLKAIPVPFEVSLIGLLFFDLSARKKERDRSIASISPKSAKNSSKKGKPPTEQKLKKARYCPNCGISVRSTATSCPNCKTKLK